MGNLRLTLAATLLLLAGATPALAAIPKVAIMAANSSSSTTTITDAINMVRGTSLAEITAADIFDVSSSGTLPTAATLKATYDAVAVYSYYKIKTGFGQVLADYLALGGGVVIFDCETASTDYGIDNPWASDRMMIPMVSESSFLKNEVHLGTIVVPGTSLLDGVTNFGCMTGSTNCWHLPAATPILHDGTVVARWSDDTPLIVTGQFGSGTVVELNFFPVPAEDTYNNGWDPATNGGELMRNALLYVVRGVSANPGAITFPTSNVGEPSAWQEITYTNRNPDPVTLTALGVGGTNPADFPVETVSGGWTGTSVTLAAGASAKVHTRFNPQASGARSALINITVQDAGTVLSTAVSGTGVGPSMVVTPSPFNMGGTPLGTPLTGLSFRVANNGGGAPVISPTVVITPADAGFTVTVPNPCTAGPGGGYCDIGVTFQSSTAGLHTATMHLTASFNGVAIPVPELIVNAYTGDAVLSVDTTIGLANQHNGTTGSATFYVSNTGNSNLTVTALTIAGDSQLTVTPPSLPMTIKPTETMPYVINFSPPAGGTAASYTAQTTVTATGAGITQPGHSTVNGKGVPFSYTTTPALVDFGDQVITGTPPNNLAVTITNSSIAKLKVVSVALTGSAAYHIVNPTPTPFTIDAQGDPPPPPPGTKLITIGMTPTSGGLQEGSLVITLDRPSPGNMITIPIRGTVLAGSLLVSPTPPLDFGSVPLNQAATPLVVALTNTGNTDLRITSLSIGPLTGDTSDQSDMFGEGIDWPQTPVTIPPGASNAITFHVTFTPTAAGIANAQINILSNDPITPNLHAALRGIGSQAGISVTPLEFDFGTALVNVPTAAAAFTIENPGDANLVIKTIAVGDPQFAVTPPGPLTIPPSNVAIVNVVYTPTTAAIAKTDLIITPDSPDGTLQPVPVHLSGIGASPSLQATPMSLTWGIVTVGKTGDVMLVTLKNTSAYHLTLGEIASSHPAFILDLAGLNMELDPGEETTFAVTFSPTAPSSISAQISISLAGGTKPIVKISASGEGMAPQPSKSGGCAVSAGQTAPTVPLMLLALAALSLLLRRQRHS